MLSGSGTQTHRGGVAEARRRISEGVTRSNAREGRPRYRIDRQELSAFLARQARLVERLPVEAADAAAGGYEDGLDDSEREAVWLAAGVATFIGQAIFEEPERFITAGEPSPATPVAVAA